MRKAEAVEMTKLQKLRQEKELSRSKLAKLAGMTARTLEHYEYRHRKIDGAKLKTLCKLSEALDCKIEDLLEDEELIEAFKKSK